MKAPRLLGEMTVPAPVQHDAAQRAHAPTPPARRVADLIRRRRADADAVKPIPADEPSPPAPPPEVEAVQRLAARRAELEHATATTGGVAGTAAVDAVARLAARRQGRHPGQE